MNRLILPNEHRRARRTVRFWFFAIPVRILTFPLVPLYAFFHGLNYAYEENRIDTFFPEWWKAVSRLTWTIWHRLMGYRDSGYHRLFERSGSCGPWTWFAEEPVDPTDGRQWRFGNGFSG